MIRNYIAIDHCSCIKSLDNDFPNIFLREDILLDGLQKKIHVHPYKLEHHR